MQLLTNPEIRKLKALAQHLEPMFKVGKAGLSDGFVKSVSEVLAQRELIKVKFVEFKKEKHELAPQLAEKTGSQLIMRVGNVAVLYRAKPAPVAESIPAVEKPKAIPVSKRAGIDPGSFGEKETR